MSTFANTCACPPHMPINRMPHAPDGGPIVSIRFRAGQVPAWQATKGSQTGGIHRLNSRRMPWTYCQKRHVTACGSGRHAYRLTLRHSCKELYRRFQTRRAARLCRPHTPQRPKLLWCPVLRACASMALMVAKRLLHPATSHLHNPASKAVCSRHCTNNSATRNTQ